MGGSTENREPKVTSVLKGSSIWKEMKTKQLSDLWKCRKRADKLIPSICEKGQKELLGMDSYHWVDHQENAFGRGVHYLTFMKLSLLDTFSPHLEETLLSDDQRKSQ